MKAKNGLGSIICFGLLLFAPALLLGQQPITLTISERISVSATVVSGLAGTSLPKCDRDGDVYLRPYQLPRLSYAAPVIKISEDGKSATRFSTDQIPEADLKGASFFDFQVGRGGEVFLLAQGKSMASYIVSFRDDGQFDSAVKLGESGFWPLKFAPFSTGEFLVAGVKNGEHGGPTGKPIMEIFDANGNPVKAVTFPGDNNEGTETGTKPTGKASAKNNAEEPTASISLGSLEPAEDGDMYLMLHYPNPKVYVISPSGVVIRNFILKSPGGKLSALDMRVGVGGFVIGFLPVSGKRVAYSKLQRGKPQQYPEERALYSVFDAESGEKVVDYQLPTELAAATLAGYTPNEFTFLLHQTGQLEILRARRR